jgi:hypothetical protein
MLFSPYLKTGLLSAMAMEIVALIELQKYGFSRMLFEEFSMLDSGCRPS